MQTTFEPRHWLPIGIVAEGLLLISCWLAFDGSGEAFRHAARYSGRISLLVFLFAFYAFTIANRRPDAMAFARVRGLCILFAVLHFIHLGFVAMNVHLNAIQLIPYKLAGGTLAYGMILLYPFIMHRFRAKPAVHLVYFYYVGLVMALTYVARMKGEFQGADPGPFHYLGLGLISCTILFFTWSLIRTQRTKG